MDFKGANFNKLREMLGFASPGDNQTGAEELPVTEIDYIK